MKTRTYNDATEQQAQGCCGATSTTSKSAAPCCDQPADGSACCDKSATKEVNSVKTGCC
ncbi:MAG: hypothetical protein RIC30_00170 [Marinoscillum sp.]|uniref:hypothetical protein n=1 Tax=Marinoscillum sp. TaxID=2024838 RepID=UPI003304BFAE